MNIGSIPSSTKPAAESAQQRHETLTKAAGQLVSQTFFGQMLKQMRNDPFKSDLFDGGRGGQMFSSLFDQTLAQRMARGAGAKLVRSIVDHMERKGGPAGMSIRNARQAGNAYQNVRIHVGTDLRA